MTQSSTTTRSLTYLIALGDVARRQALHDSCVVVGLLEAMSMVLTVKNLVICKVVKGLAPWASVWCGGKHANSYPLKPLGGGSYSCDVSRRVVPVRTPVSRPCVQADLAINFLGPSTTARAQ